MERNEQCKNAYRRRGDKSVHCKAIAAVPGMKWDYCLKQYLCRVSNRMEAPDGGNGCKYNGHWEHA